MTNLTEARLVPRGRDLLREPRARHRLRLLARGDRGRLGRGHPGDPRGERAPRRAARWRRRSRASTPSARAAAATRCASGSSPTATAISEAARRAAAADRGEVPVRTRRTHRRHRLGRVRLPDDVSRKVHRAPDPGPDVAPVGLVPRGRDAPRAGRLRPEHRLRPGAARRAAAPARDGRRGRRRIPRPAGGGRASTCRACALDPDLFTASFFVLDRPGPEPDRVLLHGRDGARAPVLRWRRSIRRSIAFVVISPNDPPAMAAHAATAASAAIPFLYDPSQQVTRLSGEEMRDGLRGRRDPDRQRLRVRHPHAQDRAVPRADGAGGARPDRHARARRLGDPRAARAGRPAACTTMPAAQRRRGGRSTRPGSATRTARACCGACGSGRPGRWPAGSAAWRPCSAWSTGPAAAPLHAGGSSGPATSATTARRPSSTGCSPAAASRGLQFLFFERGQFLEHARFAPRRGVFFAEAVRGQPRRARDCASASSARAGIPPSPTRCSPPPSTRCAAAARARPTSRWRACPAPSRSPPAPRPCSIPAASTP